MNPRLPILVIAGILIALSGLALYARANPPPRQFPAVIATPSPVSGYPPGREPIPYPVDYRTTLAHYLTVDRVDAVTRNVYISREAIEAVQRGDPIPYGTVVVIEAFDAALDSNGQPALDAQGRLIPGALRVDEIHVGERRSTWRIEDLSATSHLGGWNFRAFEFDTGTPIDKDLSDCFSCHEGASRREFLFSRPLLATYARTGEIQHVSCPLPNRDPCF